MPTDGLTHGVADDAWIRTVLTASSVGTWDWDIAADRTRVCPLTAHLFGFLPDQVERGPALADFLRAIHAEDRTPFNATVAEVRRRGGLFVAEYRTTPRSGPLRWVLARGWFEGGDTGAVTRARGIVIDVTDSRLDGYGGGRALFSAIDESASPLERFADTALTAWQGLQGLSDEDDASIRPALAALLETVGRRLAISGSETTMLRGRRPSLHS
ncbi:PAS domain-containing protein [Enterovirga rhinocerotis]|uniref:PAS domain-containing protein n=1 Tax=Enterovirga rhinocerotis TaxID=1339210 RepID=A0A4R7BJJ9_9HYPH|nr:PAS domain-containing protein [Enterovirga rhinocerotis]TDR85351.1 PAS domain-containing protein [Enterovirga rhinocerotis]